MPRNKAEHKAQKVIRIDEETYDLVSRRAAENRRTKSAQLAVLVAAGDEVLTKAEPVATST